MTMHTQTPGATGAGRELTDVAAAIFRVSLPYLAAGLYLRATHTQAGTLVQATHPLDSPAALPAVTGQDTARDLLLIDALASRWGHSGDERTRTLWAFCPSG
jgi:hypothetical protein